MSRPTAARSQSSAGENASNPTQSANVNASPIQANHGSSSFSRDSPQAGPGSHSISLPPMRQFSRTPPIPLSDRRQANPLGVHSMLNPQGELREQQRNGRRSGSQLESPSPVDGQRPPSLPSLSRPPSLESVHDEPLPSRSFQPPGPPPVRHMLGRRSPGLHRAPSVGMLGAPTGTIDAQQMPFLSGGARPYGQESATSQPHLPTPPMGPRVTYIAQGGQVLQAAPTPPPGAVRNEIRRPSLSLAQSGTASPMASYSPYSQPASVASSQFESSSQQGSFMTGANHGHSREYSNPPIPMEVETGMIPMQASGPNAGTYQVMTIKSQNGQSLQIPVEIQAASKVADEKRKRNAGASARFRARRKEKEREASQSISRLEQQLRDAIEDLDYYRNERDYFKSIVLQQPGGDHHYQRPESPRLRRTSNAPSSTGGPGSASSYSVYDDVDNGTDSDRNVRRRTSSYHPVTDPPRSHLNGSSAHHHPYGTASFPQGPSQQPTPQHRPAEARGPQHFDPRDQRHLPELQPPPSQKPILRDPFASDAARYESRAWGHGPTGDNRR